MIIDPNGTILLEASELPDSGVVKLDFKIQEQIRNRFSTLG